MSICYGLRRQYAFHIYSSREVIFGGFASHFVSDTFFNVWISLWLNFNSVLP